MIEINLGVIDQPYADPGAVSHPVAKVTKKGKLYKVSVRAAARRFQSGGARGQNKTTGDVAKILEKKYGIMEAFFTLHEPEIAADLADATAGAIENLVMGAPPTDQPWAGVTSKMQARFKEFIDSEEMAGLSGVPTKAALRGVSHRRKHPYAKGNPRRASFVDTGLYEDSMVAWIEDRG